MKRFVLIALAGLVLSSLLAGEAYARTVWICKNYGGDIGWQCRAIEVN